MILKLYTNKSPTNKVNKDITEVRQSEFTFKDGASLKDPVITLSLNPSDVAGVNYAFIPDFGRYYFMDTPEFVRAGIVSIQLHEDVLMTLKEQFLPLEAVISRQENEYNMYLPDGSFKAYQNPLVAVTKFPKSLDEPSFVLAVAGS